MKPAFLNDIVQPLLHTVILNVKYLMPLEKSRKLYFFRIFNLRNCAEIFNTTFTAQFTIVYYSTL